MKKEPSLYVVPDTDAKKMSMPIIFSIYRHESWWKRLKRSIRWWCGKRENITIIAPGKMVDESEIRDSGSLFTPQRMVYNDVNYISSDLNKRITGLISAISRFPIHVNMIILEVIGESVPRSAILQLMCNNSGMHSPENKFFIVMANNAAGYISGPVKFNFNNILDRFSDIQIGPVKGNFTINVYIYPSVTIETK